MPFRFRVPFLIFTLAALFLPVVPSLADQAIESKSAKSQSHPWWLDQINVMTWATLSQPEDQPYLAFAKELGSGVADRGIFYGHYTQSGPDTAVRDAAQSTAFFHTHGLRVTAFLSIEHWDPSPDAVTKMLAELKKLVDDGCDGIHLDMLFQPASEQNAITSITRMRDQLHQYGQQKYQRDILFTGNAWKLDSPTTLRTAAATDLVWIESWGTSELDIVRMARVGRSLGNFRIPVWYHLQPDTDTQERIRRLVNLPKALFSSCLFEDAQFLCNYKYPVPTTVTPAGSGQSTMDWKMIYINPAWRRSLVQYAAFARAYRPYLQGAVPQASVLVAFRPEEAQEANRIMDVLLARGIDFNALPYGKAPLHPATSAALSDYKMILTTSENSTLRPLAKSAALVTRVEDVLAASDSQTKHLLKIDGATNVLGRLFVLGKQRIVHLKQVGYTDARDGLPITAPLSVTLYAPGASRAFSASPESPRKTMLVLHRKGDYVTFTTPGVAYFAVAVIQ